MEERKSLNMIQKGELDELWREIGTSAGGK